MKNILLLVFAISPGMLMSQNDYCEQCDNCDNPGVWHNSDGSYYGCFDDNGHPHGCGRDTISDLSFYQVRIGCFDHGVFTNGVLLQKNQNGDTLSMVGIFDEYSRLVEGVEWQRGADNIEYTIDYKDYRAVKESSNLTNQYVESDILINNENLYSDVDLVLRNNTNYLTLKIGSTYGDWVFDTGASQFMISKKFWDRLINDGYTDFENLNIEIEFEGVGEGASSICNVYKLNNLQIGDITINNVVAFIYQKDLGINSPSLLGIGFCNKFSNVNWDLTSNILRFYK